MRKFLSPVNSYINKHIWNLHNRLNGFIVKYTCKITFYIIPKLINLSTLYQINPVYVALYKGEHFPTTFSTSSNSIAAAFVHLVSTNAFNLNKINIPSLSNSMQYICNNNCNQTQFKI